MARPRTKGLSYYSKDVDFYDDFKIMTLLDEYGPLGVTIYEVILSFVYRGDGYYLAAPLDRLVAQVVRKIGSRWIPKKDLVLQVIHFCGDIGLFHEDLLRQSVITSAGIQKRYAAATVRNKADKSLYWLLDCEQPSESIPSFGVNEAETPVSVTKTRVNEAETPTKQIKENKSKVKQSKADTRVRAQELRCAAHDVFEEMIKPLTERDSEQLTELCERYGESRVVSAVRDASAKGGRSVAYVERILSDPRNGNAQRYLPTYDYSELFEEEDNFE